MMILIIGGSSSGKSAFAEDMIVSLSKEKKNYYIATMKVYDAESEKKIERHRMLRKGKGFITLEQPVNIQNAIDKIDSRECNALLECISNLTANEMFLCDIPKDADTVAGKIVDGIKQLNDNVSQLVIVSNNVFEDGNVYDSATMEYIKAMGLINEKLGMLADSIIEVVAGIPVYIKDC